MQAGTFNTMLRSPVGNGERAIILLRIEYSTIYSKSSISIAISIIPNSHCVPDTTRQCCLCRVRRCELSRPDRPVRQVRSVSECVRRSHRQCLRRPTHSDAEGTCLAVGPTHLHLHLPITVPTRFRAISHHRLNSQRHTRHDKTVLTVSCLVCRYELDDCSERVQT